jgi:hypothetical protein
MDPDDEFFPTITIEAPKDEFYPADRELAYETACFDEDPDGMPIPKMPHGDALHGLEPDETSNDEIPF